jgi:D-sedoheptulose 7-phosphate isomerase
MDARKSFAEHQEVVADSLEKLCPGLEKAADLALSALSCGQKLLICGNGGSAADAQHFAAELVVRFRNDRKSIPCVALTTDTSVLTAAANDYGFEHVFCRQLEALANPKDVLIAISTSGNSANVVLAARRAKELGCSVIAMTGRSGGRLSEHCDILLDVPSAVVARVQEVHELCLHILADLIETASLNR